MTDPQPGTPVVPALPGGVYEAAEKAARDWVNNVPAHFVDGEGLSGRDLLEAALLAAAPLIRAAERERAEAAERALAGVREAVDAWEARYPAGGGMPEDLIADLRAIIGSEEETDHG